MPLAYVSVFKPGMGLATSQTFGPVAGFSKDGDGKVVGPKYPPAPKLCGDE